MRSREALTAELEQTRSLQLTFAQLQSDCTQAINVATYPNLPEGRSLWIDAEQLILIRTVNTEDHAPAVQVVTYRLLKGNLTRFESVATRDLSQLSALLDQAKNPPEQQMAIVMQKHIGSLRFRGWPDLSYVAGDSAGTGTSTNPVNAVSASPVFTNQSKTTTGLEVTLQLEGHDSGIVKIVILGGA